MIPHTSPTTTPRTFSERQSYQPLDPDDTGNGSDREDGGDVVNDQKTPRRFFRRPRAGRACGTCRSRRVRCDAGSHGIPCTNCTAFSLECNIPPKQKKEREGNTVGTLKRKQRSRSTHESHEDLRNVAVSVVSSQDEHIKQEREGDKFYEKLVKPEPQEKSRFEIEDPGRVAYLQEHSNMSILVKEYQGSDAGVHYPLPKVSKDSSTTRMNDLEMGIIQARGALSLPPVELCEDLIHAYFKWIAPVVPVINRSSFMKRYRDQNNPPSLLLLQAILLAGSRVCATPLLLDGNGSAIPAATLFYQRAKALYDADYEEDRVTIVQSLILMGWYWEDPGRVPKNVFYWNGLAVTVAQGCGMHRSTKESRLSKADQRLWKRIWWTLYTRDRSVAAALGRPTHIKPESSDVEMVCEDDFIEDKGVPPNSLHVQFFLQYVKVCEIMDLVLFQNYSISPKAQQHSPMALTQCDLALAAFFENVPPELRWEQSRYNFWSAYLQIVYNTTICLLHRAHLPPAPSPPLCAILARSPAFESAYTITIIVQDLIAHDDLRHTPPFVIYSMLSAVMVHIYHLHTAMPSEVKAQRENIVLCMDALERIAEIWLVGKMVRELFETVLASDGFDFDLTGTESSQQLTGMEADLKELNVAEGSTPGSHSSRSSVKRLPLTAALIAHMDAALKSATTSNTERAFDSSSTSINVLLSQSKQDPWKPLGTVAPRNEHHVSHDSVWMDHEIHPTPGPTGFNAAEWFQSYGIQ